jgi:N-acetylglucosaminyl-diphospho-decaprenol L-rhamnosyltransferase
MPGADVPSIGVVVVSWNVAALLGRCLASLERLTPLARVVVVDNASGDGSPEMVRREFPAAKLIANTQNLGFTRGSNQGLRSLGVGAGEGSATAPPFVMLLNPDAEVLGDALAVLARVLLAQPRVAAVGPRLVYPDGNHQSSCRRFPTVVTGLCESTPIAWHWRRNPAVRRYLMADADPRVAGPVDWVTGAALMLRSAALDQVGLFDEGFFMYSEELDLCRRLRDAGWAVWYEPAATVIHHEAASSGQVAPLRHRYFQRSRVRYFRKHHGRLAAGIVRAGVLASFAGELALETLKLAVGHKSELRRERVRAYWGVLQDGLAPGSGPF